MKAGRVLSIAAASVGLWMVYAAPAAAVDFQGTVHFMGMVTGTVAGIAPEDLVVSVRSSTEATGNGEKCSIITTSSDNPDTNGDYPDAGDVSAEILLERGGPQLPDGVCIVTLQAAGTDGVSVSARGATVVFVTANDIDTDATLNVDITVRESKAVAAVSKDCYKYVKKSAIKWSKCNFLLLKKGQAKIATCQKLLATGPEPAGCDDGDFTEAIVAFAHDSNDQQAGDLNDAENVDYNALRDQVKCQKRFGKAAANYAKKRVNRVRTKCLAQNADSADCRDDQSKEAKKKLDQIDRCSTDQMVDLGTETNTGRVVPDVEAPCDSCIDAGTIDRKCMKACFQMVLDELTDGIIGDLPVCGNGIVQPPEQCDDGNLANGDGCDSACEAELP